MPLLETATAYLLDLLVKNEAAKKSPQDFLPAPMQWVRSWFLTVGPVTEKVVGGQPIHFTNRQITVSLR